MEANLRRGRRSSRFITNILFFFLCALLFLSQVMGKQEEERRGKLLAGEGQNQGTRSTYIVRVRRNPSLARATTSEAHLTNWYRTFLPASASTAAVATDSPRLVYSYSNSFSGFAARLTDKELSDMKAKDGFVHAYPDRRVPLLTTHTPDFLGLRRADPTGLWQRAGLGKGVIVGVLDSGISPSHPSFSGKDMPPPPARWNGACEFNATLCNNKLIGARTFLQGSQAMRGTQAATPQAPFDDDGHGTHTAGTVAGAFVDMADFDGQATGTAAGIAPSAHLAIYKVCDLDGCALSDMLAGLDSAVADGVDVLSLSIGVDPPSAPLYNDTIAIGAFGAMEKGIFVSCAGGNDGPTYSTLINEAPWLLTVGASTADRAVRTTVTLGSGVQLDGESAFQPATFRSTQLPLVYPGAIKGTVEAARCRNGSLDDIDVKGMVVLCDLGAISSVEKGEVVKSAGGAAMIVANPSSEGYTTSVNAHVLPASEVTYADGRAIKSYISSDSAPTATIEFKGTLIGVSPAPSVGSFSSRGPNQVDPNILKPDIVGPGVNILAAWPAPLPTSSSSNSPSPFNIISGTSMATPHLSGVAALLKSVHPDWSPAAIKSAIMTSADLIANDGRLLTDQTHAAADYFAIGAGHVNPARASNPGLVYDIDPSEYVSYLCGLGYTDDQVSVVTRRPITCSDAGSISGMQLNYPTFMVNLNSANGYTVQVSRTVTNVGAEGSTYQVSVGSPMGATVTVSPEKLSFSKANEKAQFNVTFTGASSSSNTTGSYSQGFLTWTSSGVQNITVNSNIMVRVAA